MLFDTPEEWSVCIRCTDTSVYFKLEDLEYFHVPIQMCPYSAADVTLAIYMSKNRDIHEWAKCINTVLPILDHLQVQNRVYKSVSKNNYMQSLVKGLKSELKIYKKVLIALCALLNNPELYSQNNVCLANPDPRAHLSPFSMVFCLQFSDYKTAYISRQIARSSILFQDILASAKNEYDPVLLDPIEVPFTRDRLEGAFSAIWEPESLEFDDLEPLKWLNLDNTCFYQLVRHWTRLKMDYIKMLSNSNIFSILESALKSKISDT